MTHQNQQILVSILAPTLRESQNETKRVFLKKNNRRGHGCCEKDQLNPLLKGGREVFRLA
jgi:uncharacterized protein YehS (DUF1456 family)